MEQPSKFQHQLQPDMPSSSTMSTSPHPEQTPPWGALWVLALGLAMIVLDSSIVNVSIPTIIDDIGIDLTDAQWVTSLYNIVLAALLLPFGKLGDAKGRKLVFQIGTVISWPVHCSPPHRRTLACCSPLARCRASVAR